VERSQGKYFTDEQVERIIRLLSETDMSLPDIALRMRCSRSAIAAINQRFQVREYDGKRSRWTLSLAVPAHSASANGHVLS
jgi:hypothetical protein